MVSTGAAMQAMQRALVAVENNIVNASTPGYARQAVGLVANPFNPNESATSGGVSAGPLESSRNALAEAAVWRVQHRAGYSSTLSAKLGQLESAFPVTPGAGLSAEVDRFFGAVSQWSVSPNSSVSREQVLGSARGLARAFNRTAGELGEAQGQAGSELTGAVAQVNRITTDIAGLNRQIRETFGVDAGLDTRLHGLLEELSQYVNFTALSQEDGSVSILAGGGTALVIGDHQRDISIASSAGGYRILDFEGDDITSRIEGGSLAALLEYRNTLLPGYRSEIDALAAAFAGSVNTVLGGGLDQNGDPPASPLFSFDPVAGSAATGSAATLAVTAITAGQLAASLPSDPGGNGNALSLLELQSAPAIAGLTFGQHYARVTAQLGNRLNSEKADADLQTELVLQAQNLRAGISGVDINVEATKLLQLQKGFEAAGQVMSVLNSMTETVLNMVR